MFDDRNIYVGARVYDSAPPDEWIANEYRRDSAPLRQNDHIGVGFDTFYDRRSGFMFYASPLGAFSDYSIIDEGQPNSDWNPVWNVRTGRFEGGWTMEMIIPFKSLRFDGGTQPDLGLPGTPLDPPQERVGLPHRRCRRRWADRWGSTASRSTAAPPASTRRPAGRTFEIKPYALGRSSTDRLRIPPVSNDLDGQLGLDVKYGITANLVADFTYNTDFAQVEVDEQQVNLTRFNLFFPEKRDFFLEGRGIFDFARGGASGNGGAAAAGWAAASTPPRRRRSCSTAAASG